MVEFRQIDQFLLPHYIKEAYKGDKELLETYHIVNGTLEFCVKEQVSIISAQSSFDILRFYGLYVEGMIIGYTVIGKNYLYSYCINIAFRTKKILLDWWSQIVEMFKGHFGTFLYKKNDRALNFLKRNGMECVIDNGNYITLIYTGHGGDSTGCLGSS